MDSKKVLTHLIRAGRDARNMENVLSTIGYEETPFFHMYGDICDAIYTLIGEKTETFDESITCAVMTDPITPDETWAEELAPLACTPDVPDATMEVITAAATSRNIPMSTMIRLILNEWAMKTIYFQNITK